MYCHQCGKEVPDGSSFCPHCGARLDNIYGQNGSMRDTYTPIDQTQPQYQSYAREDDAPSVGFAILSFIIPIVGIVLFIVWNKEYPQKAKSCLKGFVISLVTSFVLACCLVSAGIYQYDHYEDPIEEMFPSEFEDDFFSNTVIELYE